MFNEKSYELKIGEKTVKISSGKIARQASGAVIVECGKTVLLVTATRSKEVREGTDFFPLTVDYIEKFYASGKFPGGFIKRESRPSTDEVLIARLIDRPIRPLFPEGFFYGVHIVITVISFDEVNLPENLATLGVSAALSISDIPFAGPVGGVNVGYIDGKFVLNPTPEELEISDIELSVAGTADAVTMVEAGANEIPEDIMLEAIMFGHGKIKEMCEEQEKFISQFEVNKMEFEVAEVNPEVKSFIDEKATEELGAAIEKHGKHERDDAIDALFDRLLEEFSASYENNEIPADIAKEFKNYYHDLMKKMVRESILYKKNRPDGRKTEEIRPIDVEIDTLPIPHGSALFTRGETQALVTVTLGSRVNEQIVDGMEEESRKKFYLH